MKKMYFTITGCAYRFGLAVFQPGMTVTLFKEPDNQYDREAIRAEVEGLGTVGYVANSPKTVRGTSMSAGRLYDKIGSQSQAAVEYVLPDSVICSVDTQASGSCSGEDTGLEKLPDDERFLTGSKTVDLDLYSQEDTSYLIPDTSEKNARSDSGTPEPFPDDSMNTAEKTPDFQPPAKEQAGVHDPSLPQTRSEVEEPAPVPAVEVEEPAVDIASSAAASDTAEEEADGGKTLSPEEIASALSAALAGLTAGNTEDPDAEYIYGYQTPSVSPEDIGNVLARNLGDLSAETIGAALNSSSGLSAADFVSAIAGGTRASASVNQESAEDTEISSSSGSVQDSEDSPETVVPERRERISDTPGLSFNSARFPEEEEDYAAPARESSAPASNTASANSGDTELTGALAESPADTEAITAYSEEEAESLPDAPDDSASAETAPEEAPQEAENTITAPSDTEEDVYSSSASQPDISHAAAEKEEDMDDLTKPLIYDESDLDENLAQLHLGDIDATYLSDSFLANLKKSLRESS